MSNHHDNLDMSQPSHRHSTIPCTLAATTTNDATGNAEFDIGEAKNVSLKDGGGDIPSSSSSVSLLHGVSEDVITSDCPGPSGELLLEPQFPDNLEACEKAECFKSLLVAEQWISSDFEHPRSIDPSGWKTPSSSSQTFYHKTSSVTCEPIIPDGQTEIVTKSIRTDAWNINADLDTENTVGIYAGGRIDPASKIVGSCAVRQVLDSGRMQTQCDLEASTMSKDTGEQKSYGAKREEKKSESATDTRPISSQWRFQASAGTLFQIRTSHLLKLTFMLLLLIAVFAVVFHSRIRTLEEEKRTLLGEIGTLKLNVQLLMKRMEDVVNLIPPRSQRNNLEFFEEELESGFNDSSMKPVGSRTNAIGNMGQATKRIVKRSAAASRTTKDLFFSSQSMSTMNELNNETASTYGVDDWTTTANKGVTSQKSFKGNRQNMKDSFPSPRTKQQRRFRKQLRKLKKYHRLQINDLKQKLLQTQHQISAAQNFSCCNHTLPNTVSLAESALGVRNTRAVYLQIDGSSVNIKKQRQLIGPWFLPKTGNEIGFNNMWYEGLKLDSNGTSIIFQEDGLFLISAQVFYTLPKGHESRSATMGYRIHLKKSGNNSQSMQRSLTIAECVPSFPATVLQTCFTQVVWYIEANDEVCLEHFTEAQVLPFIEALQNGQTFLGVVRF